MPFDFNASFRQLGQAIRHGPGDYRYAERRVNDIDNLIQPVQGVANPRLPLLFLLVPTE
jgi:hypothetical protein